MPKYFFTILEKMLSPDEEKATSISKSEKTVNFKPTSEKIYTKKNEQPKSNNEKKYVKKDSNIFCLFSGSGDSIFVNNNGNRVTVKLNGINHTEKYTKEAKEANNFLNTTCKGKNVYLNIISQEKDMIIADVFLSPEKTNSVNEMLVENGLDKSISSKSINNSDMTEQEIKTVKESLNKSVAKKDNNQIIGYLIDFGKAPYLNNPENKSSYFISIEKDNVKSIKWGIDLERAIKESKAKKNDYIKLTKGESASTGNGTYSKTIWKIDILEDVNSVYKDIPGPPVDDIPLDEIDYNSSMEKDSNYDVSMSDNSYIYETNLMPEHHEMEALDSILSDLEHSDKNIKLKI